MSCVARKLSRLRGGWDPNAAWDTILNSNEWTQTKNKIMGRYGLDDGFLNDIGEAIYEYDSAYLNNDPTTARQVKSRFIHDNLLYLQRHLPNYDQNREDLYGSALRKMWNYIRTVIHRGPIPVTRAQIAADRARWRQKRQQQIQAAIAPDIPWIGSAGHFTRLRLGKLIPQQPRVRIGKWREILGVPQRAALLAAPQPPQPAPDEDMPDIALSGGPSRAASPGGGDDDDDDDVEPLLAPSPPRSRAGSPARSESASPLRPASPVQPAPAPAPPLQDSSSSPPPTGPRGRASMRRVPRDVAEVQAMTQPVSGERERRTPARWEPYESGYLARMKKLEDEEQARRAQQAQQARRAQQAQQAQQPTGNGELSYLRRIDPYTFAQRRRLLNAYRRGMILFPKYRRK
ncbi:TPA_asm: hypothetical protein [Sheep rumen MELD virus]|nr:TPA_asm: hypothetical protein [Sheep rumen MELD virus]